jgi:hypothetical protein
LCRLVVLVAARVSWFSGYALAGGAAVDIRLALVLDDITRYVDVGGEGG